MFHGIGLLSLIEYLNKNKNQYYKPPLNRTRKPAFWHSKRHTSVCADIIWSNPTLSFLSLVDLVRDPTYFVNIRYKEPQAAYCFYVNNGNSCVLYVPNDASWTYILLYRYLNSHLNRRFPRGFLRVVLM